MLFQNTHAVIRKYTKYCYYMRVLPGSYIHNKEKRMAENKKFSFAVFFIKLTSRAFWVWLITTAVVGYVLYKILKDPTLPSYTWMTILLVIWGVTALLFIGGNVLIEALSKMVEKANLTINSSINATANTSISGAAGGSASSVANKDAS